MVFWFSRILVFWFHGKRIAPDQVLAILKRYKSKPLFWFSGFLVVFPAIAFVDTVTTDVVTDKVTAIDGDTLRLDGESIRLSGIDAPEKQQACFLRGEYWPCGLNALYALKSRVNGHSISCKVTSSDKYDRILAECFVEGQRQSINQWLVSEGWAVAYRQYSDRYVLFEWKARLFRKGVWRSQFEMPWVWRRRKK